MLHHSNSRNQRNRGSRIKTLLQATLLLGVVIWLLYQVKHSYDRKNEYLDDTEDQLAHNDRSMFQGRKGKAGSYSDSNVEMAGENSNEIAKPEGAVEHHSDTFDHNEEKNGETVFEKDSTDLHEDEKSNTERSEAEEGQANSSDGNTEAQADKHDVESNSDSEGTSEDHSTRDEASHDEVVQGDKSTNTDQTNPIGNGSDGEEGEKKVAVDTQTGSESLPDDAKTETSDGQATGSLPDESGNIPSVHSDNSQNDASENQGDPASTKSVSSKHSTGEAVHIETGLEDEGATASSETASGDDKGNSVETNSSLDATAEEKTGTASGDDDKGAEAGASNEVSDSKAGASEEGYAATGVANDHVATTETENSQGDSAAEVVNGSSEETKPVENQSGGATEASNNTEQEDTKIETSTSTNDEHGESKGGDGSSISNDSNGSGSEQTGTTETQ